MPSSLSQLATAANAGLLTFSISPLLAVLILGSLGFLWWHR